MKLTPEDGEKVRTKNLANIIRKANAEKPLTRGELLQLEQAKATGALPTSGVTGNFAATWDELAQVCGVDRRTLTNTREKFAKELLATEKEWLRADGRKDIAWWLRFLDEKGVRGRGVNNPESDYIDERQLRLKREKYQLDKAVFELEKAKDQMLPVGDFEAALGVTIGNFRAVGNALPGRAAGKIVQRARAALLLMLKGSLTAKQFEKVEEIVQTAPVDYADVEEILQDEWTLVLRTLETCDYLIPDLEN